MLAIQNHHKYVHKLIQVYRLKYLTVHLLWSTVVLHPYVGMVQGKMAAICNVYKIIMFRTRGGWPRLTFRSLNEW